MTESLLARSMNKIEEYKKQKDGLDVLEDVPRYASEGWEAITDGDKERLKWAGVFFRKQTPGNFMMRVRIMNGITSATQFRALAEISEEFGKGFCDITTRQQIQLRWFKIENVPEIWRRLDMVGLVSLQTGMDNIRNVVGCPVAGLTPNELGFGAAFAYQSAEGIFVEFAALTAGTLCEISGASYARLKEQGPAGRLLPAFSLGPRTGLFQSGQ
jgi:ferredoxin-nitrite reductase